MDDMSHAVLQDDSGHVVSVLHVQYSDAFLQCPCRKHFLDRGITCTSQYTKLP